MYSIREKLAAFALAATALSAHLSHAQMDDVTIDVERVADGIYMLAGRGGNIGLSIGKEATFIIDDQFAPLTGKITAAIATVTDRPVDYVFNTHWHYDHVGGNEHLGAAGALILAHDNVRGRMKAGQFFEISGRNVEPAPAVALPVVTFDDGLKLHINGQTVEGIHVADAHTDGDTLVFFREANVLHTGDTFVKDSFPFVDMGSGGSIDGLIAAAEVSLSLTDENSRIIPGHGALANRADLEAIHNMMKTIRDRVARMIDEGKSLAEILSTKPTEEFDARFGGSGFITNEVFVGFVHKSLTAGE